MTQTIINPDSPNHSGPDSGCPIATAFLGYQSRCQRCPFLSCIYDMTLQQRKQIIELFSLENKITTRY